MRIACEKRKISSKLKKMQFGEIFYPHNSAVFTNEPSSVAFDRQDEISRSCTFIDKRNKSALSVARAEPAEKMKRRWRAEVGAEKLTRI